MGGVGAVASRVGPVEHGVNAVFDPAGLWVTVEMDLPASTVPNFS